MTRGPFGARLPAAMDAHGPLCVGIDPHPSLLRRRGGCPTTPPGLRAFALTVLEAVGGHVAAVKPQAAFFERHGSAGVAVLEEVVAAGRETGTLVIVDAKRGDIGSTMDAYADAFLRDGSPLAGDALTVSPYLGFGSLDPAVDLALSSGRGLFVLCLTSNPEGHEVQHARTDDGVSGRGARGRAAAAALNAGADAARARSASSSAPRSATRPRARGVDLAAVNGPLLAPGVGAQGAGAARAGAGLRRRTPAGARVLVARRARRRARRRGRCAPPPGVPRDEAAAALS